MPALLKSTQKVEERSIGAQKGSPHFDVIRGRVPNDRRKRKLLFTVRRHGKYQLWYDTEGCPVTSSSRRAELNFLLSAGNHGEYWMQDPHFKDSDQVVVVQATKQEFYSRDTSREFRRI